jgi:hypothetical protein
MSNKTNFALPRRNLMLIAIAFAVTVIGFLLMIGGVNEGTWNPEIFSFRRIVLAPLIVLSGFVLAAFAILWIPKKERE